MIWPGQLSAAPALFVCGAATEVRLPPEGGSHPS